MPKVQIIDNYVTVRYNKIWDFTLNSLTALNEEKHHGFVLVQSCDKNCQFDMFNDEPIWTGP